MRQAFINSLVKEAQKNKQVWLLTGDLGFTVLEPFCGKFPDRFINVGVAEQNMVGVAAGLATTDRIVFVYSIATFATMRPFEFIRNNIALHKLPVIVVGSGGGLCYSHALSTHHALEDIGLMRSIPEMTVVCPADKYEVEWAVQEIVKQKKPAYLRLGKTGEPNIYKQKPKLKLGKGKILRKGEDLAIFSTGNLLHNSLRAAEILAKKGKEATVVSMHTVKPLDADLINKIAKKNPFIVTVEEHYISGGLGSSVAEILFSSKNQIQLYCIGVPDQFVKDIGSHFYLREKFGLNPQQIARKICSFL